MVPHEHLGGDMEELEVPSQWNFSNLCEGDMCVHTGDRTEYFLLNTSYVTTYLGQPPSQGLLGLLNDELEKMVDKFVK